MRLAITAGQESNSDSSNTDQRRVSSEMGRSLGRGPPGGLRFAADLLVFIVMLSALPGRFYLAAARVSVKSAKSAHWPDLFFAASAISTAAFQGSSETWYGTAHPDIRRRNGFHHQIECRSPAFPKNARRRRRSSERRSDRWCCRNPLGSWPHTERDHWSQARCLFRGRAGIDG